MRAEEEYVPERDEEKEDAEEVLGELESDRTEVEEVEEEAEREPEEVRSDEIVRRAAMVEVVRDVLVKQPIETARIDALAEHDREAVEFLTTIVEGRTKGGAFVYAEQRLQQLNLVLADLQPLLAVGAMEGLDVVLAEVIDGFEALRRELLQLEDAEEEMTATEQEKPLEAGDGDDDKDDEGTPEGEAPAEPAPGEPQIKAEKLWKRLWKRGKKPEQPAAAAPAPATTAPAGAPGDRDADTESERPKKSTVWDPDDRGGGGA